jgi:hypothetical protein
MQLSELRKASQISQKKGIHFIIASVIIWTAVFLIHTTSLSIDVKNLLTFVATAPLMPLAFAISKLLIAMWIMNQQPESLVMILAMIFGAHLLPYSWLYQSRSYQIFAILIPLLTLLIGLLYSPALVAGLMILIELIFVFTLSLEISNTKQN